jgi:uncharacterized protein (DUF58 family)
MSDGPTAYLDPAVLARISHLELKARLVVEGFMTGLHRSPHRGHSVEFAQHREYSPGDEIRHVDWKVFGRTDRFFIKQFEEETNLKCYLLLDASASMGYKSGPMSKLEYGAHLAAAMAFLMLRQQDSVGLAVFDREVRTFIPARGTPVHLKPLIQALEAAQPALPTDMGRAFHDLAERLHRRGLVVVISDLLEDPKRVLATFAHFRHRKHEVIVFHVLDRHEVEFPFQDQAVMHGLEDGRRILVEPRSIRRAYLDELARFTAELRRGCREARIDYVPLVTDQPLDVALGQYLARRART